MKENRNNNNSFKKFESELMKNKTKGLKLDDYLVKPGKSTKFQFSFFQLIRNKNSPKVFEILSFVWGTIKGDRRRRG